jgi:hypothetical protein
VAGLSQAGQISALANTGDVLHVRAISETRLQCAAKLRTRAMRRFTPFSAVLFGLGLSGCAATMGMGVGATPAGEQRTTFQWRSTGATSGQMTATLDSGQTFTGRYFQITRRTNFDTLGPLWAGWGPGFYGPGSGLGPWGYWGPTDQFLTQYTGRVVGNLQGPKGTHMRCRFTLARPDIGMAGGGLGQCQLPSGTTIDAMFPTG